MVLKKMDSFNKDDINGRLKAKGRDGRWFMIYVDFLFSIPVQVLIIFLNMKFMKTKGHPAYDRTLLLGILMYAFHQNVFTLTGVSYLTRNDEVLKCFTCGEEISANTFDNFLRESSPVVMKAIFVCTLVELNDLGYVDFRRIYCDSTNANINGSIHYKVVLCDLEAFQLLNEWGLIHNGAAGKMDKYWKRVNKKKELYKDDEEMLELIDHILKNFKLYNKRVYRKYPVFEKYLSEDPDGYVSVMFPEARFLKTKKGRFEFALLIQQCMLKDGIILSGLLQSAANDSESLEEVIKDLKLTVRLFVLIQTIWGERENYDEIANMLKHVIMVLDSGYFSDENLRVAYESGINILIMPKVIARRINDELRGKKFCDIDYILENDYEKITKRELNITTQGYQCPMGLHSIPEEPKLTNSKFNKELGDCDEIYKEHSYKHHFPCVQDCPLKDICNVQDIEDRISGLKYEMIHKFTLKRYLKIYKERFGGNEQIFAYMKGLTSEIKLFGSNMQATQNHLQIMNTCYNIQRKESLKQTKY